jgi:hypothetical protein
MASSTGSGPTEDQARLFAAAMAQQSFPNYGANGQAHVEDEDEELEESLDAGQARTGYGYQSQAGLQGVQRAESADHVSASGSQSGKRKSEGREKKWCVRGSITSLSLIDR